MNQAKRVPTMLGESAEGLSESDRTLLENVAQYGFHWVSVGQSEQDRTNSPEWREVPGWSYTIGLHASHGHPEIVVFELEDEIVGPLLWDMAEAIEAGSRFEAGQIYDNVLPSFEGQRFAFEQVSPGWIRSLFGFGSWFYKHEDFPVLQYLWPDRTGLFVWEEGAGETIREAQPVLTQPPMEEDSPPKTQLNGLQRTRAGQKLGKSSGPADRPSDTERARKRALWKLPGLDSNQQPSG